jgi:hypothetical protein
MSCISLEDLFVGSYETYRAVKHSRHFYPKSGLVGLSGRLRTLAGLIAQQAYTIPIVEHAKPQ